MTATLSTGSVPRPREERPTPGHDVVFVGAGASAAYVLLALLAGLPRATSGEPVRIAVVDRQADFFSGVAYGSRAARTSLLITPLRDFLPDDERALFTGWLARHKDGAFDEFLAAAGPLGRRWWEQHRAEIERDEFDELFLPRYVFGRYLMERTRAAVDAATRAGVATVDLVHREVVAIDRTGDAYRVEAEDVVLTGRHVVLATGSAPVRPRLADGAAPPPTALIDDPFAGMGAALDRIREAVDHAGPGRPPHVVVLGGNAGTMDMMFQVNDLATTATGTTFTVLSPQGKLPERMDSRVPARPFTAERLRALEAADDIRAEDVYRAALEDIARGRAANLTVGDTLAPISQGLGRLVRRLSGDEAVAFAGRWGVELGRHQRRAGWEYCDVLDELAAEGRLQVVAGSFVDVRPADGGVTVRYLADGELRELDRPADAVINCAGPDKRLVDASSALAARLIDQGVCRATPLGGGIAVDSNLEAASGFYVMGPLLAGNVVGGSPVWHMEHCGRISTFGTALGRRIAQVLAAQPTTA